jgi:hypothetical protein
MLAALLFTQYRIRAVGRPAAAAIGAAPAPHRQAAEG